MVILSQLAGQGSQTINNILLTAAAALSSVKFIACLCTTVGVIEMSLFFFWYSCPENSSQFAGIVNLIYD